MGRYDNILDKLISLCQEHDDISTVILIGSRARSYDQADEYSDIDLVIGCEKPELFLWGNDYVEKLGRIVYSFTEPTIAGETERRILFEGSLDVDIIPIKTEALRALIKKQQITEIMNRGIKVLYDNKDFTLLLSDFSESIRPKKGIMSEERFINLTNDFMFHTVWAEKKLKRGELWVAKMCVDGYLKNHLLEIIELYTLCAQGSDTDVWHSGRMLEKWAPAEITAELEGCFAVYDEKSVRDALTATKALFVRLAKTCAEKLGYSSCF